MVVMTQQDTYCHLTVYFINKKWWIWKIFYVYFTTQEKILHFTGKEIQIKTTRQKFVPVLSRSGHGWKRWMSPRKKQCHLPRGLWDSNALTLQFACQEPILKKHQYPDWEYETKCIHTHSLYAGRPEGCHQGMTTWGSIWKTESTVGKTEHRTQGCRAPIPVQLKENGMQKGAFEQKLEMILQSDAGGTGRRKCGAGRRGRSLWIL